MKTFYKTAPRITYTEEQFMKKLSMEAAFASNVVDFFREGFSSTIETLKGYLTAFQINEEDPDIVGMERDFSQMEKNHFHEQYLNYRGLLVQVPEGFTGEFLPYALMLNKVGATLFDQLNQCLSEYRGVLSLVVSSQTHRTSLKDFSEGYKRTSAAREELKRELSQYFNASSNTRARLNDVFPQYGNIKPFIGQVKALVRYTDKKQLMKVKQSVQDVADIMTLFEQQVKNNELTDISPQAVKNIAQGAYELGRFLDQVVVYQYSVRSLIQCSNLLMKKLADIHPAMAGHQPEVA